ncbi:MAG: OmpA family protein [Deltaproteobacteria bacterium]|nr:OmpA family protein [Deltaproteobacteria bacterium]
MKIFTGITVLVIAATVLTGCPKKATIVKEEAKAPVVDMKAEEEAKAKAEAEAKAKKEAEAEAKIKAEAEAKARAEAEAGAKAEAEAEAETEAKTEAAAKEAVRLEDIHFDFDMYEIRGNDKEILSALAELLLKKKDANLLLEGHADDRGNSAYNLALGERRAQSAREYLVTLGVGAARISTTSYGQEKPVCSEPNEDCWWKNRRVHFVVQEQR